jgi:hypothetical protein
MEEKKSPASSGEHKSNRALESGEPTGATYREKMRRKVADRKKAKKVKK